MDASRHRPPQRGKPPPPATGAAGDQHDTRNGKHEHRQRPGARDDAPPRDRLVISPDSRQVTIDGKCIALTVGEFDLLSILASRRGKVVSRDELCKTLLRREYDGLDRCIDLRMSRLRKKLEDNARLPRLIKSVRSEGYMLVKQ